MPRRHASYTICRRNKRGNAARSLSFVQRRVITSTCHAEYKRCRENLSVSGDLRFHRESQKDSERMRMRAIVAQPLQGGDAEITSKSRGAGDLSFVAPFAARAAIFMHRLITEMR